MPELKVTNHKPPYSYLKPVINGVSYDKYENLSIEEIREQFGDNKAQWVYFMATKGIDLTKPPAPKLESEPYVKVSLSQNGSSYLCQLFVSESEKYTLFNLTIDEAEVGKEAVHYMINDLLYASLQKIGVLKQPTTTQIHN